MNYEITDCYAQRAIEIGYITVVIEDTEIVIEIEQFSDGGVVFILDDMEYKELLQRNEIQFQEGSNDLIILGPEEFLDDLFEYYDRNSRKG